MSFFPPSTRARCIQFKFCATLKINNQFRFGSVSLCRFHSHENKKLGLALQTWCLKFISITAATPRVHAIFYNLNCREQKKTYFPCSACDWLICIHVQTKKNRHFLLSHCVNEMLTKKRLILRMSHNNQIDSAIRIGRMYIEKIKRNFLFVRDEVEKNQFRGWMHFGETKRMQSDDLCMWNVNFSNVQRTLLHRINYQSLRSSPLNTSIGHYSLAPSLQSLIQFIYYQSCFCINCCFHLHRMYR